MSTNYYLISKIDSKKQKQLDKIKKELLLLTEKATTLLSEQKTRELKCSIDCLSLSEKIHIGQNSFGWKFLFQGKNFLGLENFLFQLKNKYQNHIIQDEYERHCDVSELVDAIKKSSDKKQRPECSDFSSDGFPLLFQDFS